MDKTEESPLRRMASPLYQMWINDNEPTLKRLGELRRESNGFSKKPKFSILTPVFDPDEEWLRAAIGSVMRQTYDNWELCLADDRSTKPHVANVLREYSQSEPRAKVVFAEEHVGISKTSNLALSLATGDLIALLDHDDELAPFALHEVAKLLQNREADVIYSDEDKIDLDGYRYAPFFKPEWCPDLSLSYMYTGHLGVYRRALIVELGGFRNAVSGAQDYDLLIRSSEMTSKILHIPKILYHWRAVSGSAALSVEAKDWGLRACKRALNDAMQRRGIEGNISDGLLTGIFHFKRDITDSQSITIVAATTTNDVPFHGGLFEETGQVEKILVVRDRRLLEDRIPRNKSIHIIESASDSNVSAMCNLGAEAARGEHILFLGEAVTPKGKDSVTALLEHSQRSEVGAVGGKIIGKNDKVIHAGYVLGLRGIAGSPLMGRPAHHPGYFGSLKVIRNCSAVSASFLMIKKTLFRDIGGFDTRFRQAYHDLDLCLRLRTKGLLNVYTPYAEATVTARSVDREALDGNGHKYDAISFVRKWGSTLDDPDPYYSRNMSSAFDFVPKCRLFGMESSPSNDPSLLSLIETYSMRPDLQAAFPPSESSAMKKLMAWGITSLDEDSRNRLRKITDQIRQQLPEAWFT